MRDLHQDIESLNRAVGDIHRRLRGMGQGPDEDVVRRELEQQRRDIRNLSEALSRLEGQASGDPQNIQYVEQIPGRRIPFDMMVTLPISSGVTATQQASTSVSQDGPFVAVARFATFQSAYQFNRTDPDTQAVTSFQGRSFGRYRPIHSAWDINDANPQYQPVVGGALPGTGAAIYASPSNHSNFRTMEFDGTIEFLHQGSSFRRQNIPLPSAFYTQQINAPFSLGALDFFERGTVLEWNITPLHVNNPGFGNASGFSVGGSYPFLDSQYDVHEGVVDPEIATVTTDPVTRLPDGILTIGFHGYRIVQPAGTVSPAL